MTAHSSMHARFTQPSLFAYTLYGWPHPPCQRSVPGFAGGFHEASLAWQLLGNGYRAYNPVLMRFHSPDNRSPFAEGGLNTYAYCQGDPLNRTDPSGHGWLTALGFKRMRTSPGSVSDRPPMLEVLGPGRQRSRLWSLTGDDQGALELIVAERESRAAELGSRLLGAEHAMKKYQANPGRFAQELEVHRPLLESARSAHNASLELLQSAQAALLYTQENLGRPGITRHARAAINARVTAIRKHRNDSYEARLAALARHRQSRNSRH